MTLRSAAQRRREMNPQLSIPASAANPQPTPGLWAPLERVLALLKDFVAVVDLGDRGELLARLDGCQRGMSAARDLDAMLHIVTVCQVTCGSIIARLNQNQSRQEAEIASIVGMVREALAAVAGDGRALNTDLGLSMGRFAALVEIDDPATLKQQLADEVKTLRDLAEATERRWDETCRGFTAKIEALHAQIAETEEDAMLDPLSGLMNRRGFERALATRLTAGGAPFVLAMIDVDRLKSVNDTFGQPAGDDVIAAVGKALKSSVRSKSDVVARFGGDEFVVLLADSDLDHAAMRLRIVGAGVAATFRAATPRMEVTLSTGLAQSRATDGIKTLMERADGALRQAKQLGRNRVAREEALH